MNTQKRGMKMTFLFIMVVLACAVSPTPARAADFSGTRASWCDLLYSLTTPIPTWNSIDADWVQYVFNFKMTYGKDDKQCGNETPIVVNVKALGNWYEKSGMAHETISIYSAESRLIGSIDSASKCPKNPWISSEFVACTLMKIENSFEYHFAEDMKYPVTALYLGRTGREQLSAKYSLGTGGFVITPQKSPEVCIGTCGSDNYKFGHGENAKIDIHKPSDASPEWCKKGQYDVEFEYKPGGKMAIAGWAKKTLVSSVQSTGDITSFLVPNVKFFDEPVENWTITTIGDKKYRQFRVHARAHGIAPWSEWRSFLMEIPRTTFFTPSTGTSKPVPRLK
jgi:hypothetical protein